MSNQIKIRTIAVGQVMVVLSDLGVRIFNVILAAKIPCSRHPEGSSFGHVRKLSVDISTISQYRPDCFPHWSREYEANIQNM